MAKNETEYEAVSLIHHHTKGIYVHPGETCGFTPVAAKKLLEMGVIKPIEPKTKKAKPDIVEE